jgi:hypothetical protein
MLRDGIPRRELLANPLAVLIYIVLSCQIPGQEINPKLEALPEVSLLDLQKNGDTYNNHRVRVQGEYLIEYGHHSVVVRDPKKGNILVDIWLDLEDESDIAKEYRNLGMAEYYKLIFSDELKNILNNISWIVPLPVEKLPASQLRAIQEYWEKKNPKPIRVTIVGRFDYVKGGRLIMLRNGQMDFTNGFGAGSRWAYRIVVETMVLQKTGT